MTIDKFITKHHPKTGKEPWISYCEAIITEDGQIYEAVPSHERKLAELACKKLNCSYEELQKMIQCDMSPSHWIIDRINAVSIWYEYGIAYMDYLYNKKVVDALRRLEAERMIVKDSYLHYNISREYHLQMWREENGWYL